MKNSNYFEFESKTRRNVLLFLALGIIAVLAVVLFGDIAADRIWANLLVNSIFFTGVAVLALFFLATHYMAFSGWHVTIKRIPEAMTSYLPVGGIFMLIIVVGAIMNYHHIYHWTDTFITEKEVTVGELRDYEAHLAGHGSGDHGEEHGEEHEEGHEETNQQSSLENGQEEEGPQARSVFQQTAYQAGEEHDDGHGHAADSHSEDTHADESHADEMHANESHSPDTHGEASHEKGAHGEASHGDFAWYKLKEHHGDHHETFAGQYAGLSDDAMIENPHYDKLIAHKTPYLNKGFFGLRFVIYFALWILFAYLMRRASLREDREGGISHYKRSKVYAAIFMVVFGVTSSTMAWDYLMSIDTHWFSTLYGWYITVSLFVACTAVIILTAIYLKYNGYLVPVNENHLHDLGKYLFGFSVFWTYLWFSQFMLYWYSNIPEETMYFLERFRDYKFLFYANLGFNFIFPFIVLMMRKAKRMYPVLIIVAVVLICTHWMDLYLAVIPGATAGELRFGLLEIGMFVAFASLFVYVTLQALTRAALIPIKHPFFKESILHHT